MTWQTRTGRGLRWCLLAAALTAPLPAAGADDERDAAARQALTEGEALRAQETAEGNRRAAERFEEAARLWREMGDAGGEARALLALGMMISRTEAQRALPLLQRSLDLRRGLGERAGEAESLTAVGIVHYYLGDQEKAIEHQREAIALARAVGDATLEARAGNNLGLGYSSIGEHVKALEQYDEVLALWRKLGNREQEARTLNNVGVVHWSLGELQEALAAWRQSLVLRRQLHDRRGEGITLHNLGMIYHTAGEHRRALDHYEQALAIRRAVGDRRGEAKTLHNIASIHALEHEDAKALETFQQTLVLRREVGDRPGLALTLDQLGRTYQARGETDKAQAAFEEAIEVARQTQDRRVEAFPLQGLGLAQAARGERAQALASLRQALALFRSLGERAPESEALYQIARIQRDAGDLDEARAQVEASIALRESLRSGVAGDELRTAYVASSRAYYDLHVDVLMRLHARRPAERLDALAFASSERARARGLLDTLTAAHAGIREGVAPELLDAERELRRRLSAKERQRMDALGGKEPAARAEAIERELAALLREYHDLQEKIRVSSPRYADLTQPAPLTLAEIQRQVVDEDSLLLEYALGDERSFVWAVTRDAMRSHELPGRKAIEDAARRAHDLLTRSDRRALRGQTDLAMAQLSRLVLAPVADLLSGRRLLVVAEGALHYVPFAALPHPGQGAGAPPLIVSREVVHLPSASSLALLRRDLDGRAAAPRLVAVLSDPVFRADDPRVAGAARASRTASSVPASSDRLVEVDLTRAVTDAGFGALERLPFSRREAESIAALAPGDATLKALDFAASRATATSPALADYRIVHFAAHGLVNNRHPELSGIALSMVDETGGPQDGFLRLSDLYNLKLGADLVVLSACQTALGKEVKGEGLVGLTRGFFYAGAPRVIASLWSVRDEATSTLMKRFYAAMLKDGRSPSAALRAAQVSLWQDPRWRSPYYWAGFILQGEWKPTSP